MQHVIEAERAAGMIRSTETTVAYLKGGRSPRAVALGPTVAHWQTLRSDPGAKFDKEVTIDARTIKPQVTWGTSPEGSSPVDERRSPTPTGERIPSAARAWRER